MVAQSLPQQSSRPRPVDPERVYQTWLHECESAGEWGAYRRTGDRYGRSDEWARKVVKRYQERAAAATTPADDPLKYTPPPDAYPEPIAPTIANAAPLRQDDLPTAATEPPPSEGDITGDLNSAGANCQPATDANCQPVERDLAVPPVLPAHPATPHLAPVVKIVRLPAEQPRRDLYSRLASVHADTIAGPPLALAVALVLIALAFWGLG